MQRYVPVANIVIDPPRHPRMQAHDIGKERCGVWSCHPQKDSNEHHRPLHNICPSIHVPASVSWQFFDRRPSYYGVSGGFIWFLESPPHNYNNSKMKMEATRIKSVSWQFFDRRSSYTWYFWWSIWFLEIPSHNGVIFCFKVYKMVQLQQHKTQLMHSSLTDTAGQLVQFDITGEPSTQRRPRVAFVCCQIYNPWSKCYQKIVKGAEEITRNVGTLYH